MAAEQGRPCRWPEEPPGSGRWGCGETIWFRPTGKIRRASSGGPGTPVMAAQDADGTDHHATCAAFLARLERERAEREAEVAARPTLF
jgi:hypothetical protein